MKRSRLLSALLPRVCVCVWTVGAAVGGLCTSLQQPRLRWVSYKKDAVCLCLEREEPLTALSICSGVPLSTHNVWRLMGWITAFALCCVHFCHCGNASCYNGCHGDVHSIAVSCVFWQWIGQSFSSQHSYLFIYLYCIPALYWVLRQTSHYCVAFLFPAIHSNATKLAW